MFEIYLHDNILRGMLSPVGCVHDRRRASKFCMQVPHGTKLQTLPLGAPVDASADRTSQYTFIEQPPSTSQVSPAFLPGGMVTLCGVPSGPCTLFSARNGCRRMRMQEVTQVEFHARHARCFATTCADRQLNDA